MAYKQPEPIKGIEIKLRLEAKTDKKGCSMTLKQEKSMSAETGKHFGPYVISHAH